MRGIDLTDEQRDRLFAVVERHRLWLERLHERCVARGFPPADSLRLHVARALRAHRRLCLEANEGRRKGVYRRYVRRSRSWPAV